MSLDNKINILKKIYAVYDQVTASFDVACRHFCAHCCTRNVTMTTIEGFLLFSGMPASYIVKIKNNFEIKRFIPKITTNGIAELCIGGKDLPEEEDADPSWGSCPILTDNACPFYDVRPFGCRCFMSKINCSASGFADVDPFVITLNNVFLQHIEHIDDSGLSGNFSDVMMFMASKENRDAYETGAINSSTGHLINNRSMKSLLVPPEHRKKIMPIINKLNQIH